MPCPAAVHPPWLPSRPWPSVSPWPTFVPGLGAGARALGIIPATMPHGRPVGKGPIPTAGEPRGFPILHAPEPGARMLPPDGVRVGGAGRPIARGHAVRFAEVD